jgi:hypothetical protein
LADIVAPVDSRAVRSGLPRTGVEPFALFEPADPTDGLAPTDASHPRIGMGVGPEAADMTAAAADHAIARHANLTVGPIASSMITRMC